MRKPSIRSADIAADAAAGEGRLSPAATVSGRDTAHRASVTRERAYIYPNSGLPDMGELREPARSPIVEAIRRDINRQHRAEDNKGK